MKKFLFSLRFRISIILLFLILPQVLLFDYINQDFRQRSIDHVLEETLAYTRYVSDNESEFISNTRDLLIALSIHTQLHVPDLNTCDHLLSDLLPQYKQFLNIGIADQSGNIICSALPMEKSVNIFDRDYFIKAVSTKKFAIGRFQIGRITHQPAVNFGYPILNQNGKVIGVVYVAVENSNLPQFDEDVSLGLPEVAVLTKLDNQGTILARSPEQNDLIGQLFATPVIREKILGNPEGYFQGKDLNNNKIIYSFSQVPSDLYKSDIYIVYEINEDILFGDINLLFNRVIILMIAINAVLVLGSWAGFDFLLMRQLRSMQYASSNLIKGDMEARAAVFKYGNSEFNELSIAFNNMADTLQQRESDLIQAYDATIQGWADALDLRDKETEGHSKRVTDLTVNLAKEMGISEEEIIHIRRGALLHDVGKLGVPDKILLKPGKLTREEWDIMKMHPIYAYQMLNRIDYLEPALEIPYCHHERWDGNGYPRRLKGKEIPLSARIFAVVDVWDALRSDRPYRKAWSIKKTLDYISSESGSYFDPEIVEMFFSKYNSTFNL
jgi:hypothetical protein